MSRLAAEWRSKGTAVGLVPTMGYLHAGHLSLVHRARACVGKAGKVVVSVYVNPTQFAPTEDLSSYPRDLARDIKLCLDAGVDVLFLPADEQMYPRRAGLEFSTYVLEEKLSRRMEGESRPTHFRGVTTVVAKLFNLVQPEVSVFGAKDYQQAAIIRRMVRDLNIPTRVLVAPTVREHDGLAMSSRNKYLQGEERVQALVLWKSIRMARRKVAKSRGGVSAATLSGEVARLTKAQALAKLDYVEFFDPATLAPASRVKRGTHMALAVFVGKTRLIDNGRL